MTVKVKVALIGGGLILLACGLGGAMVLKVVDFPIAAGELPAAMKDAESLGLPLTASEVAPAPDPKKTPIDFSRYDLKEFTVPFSNISKSDLDWSSVGAVVAKHQSDLDDLRRTAQSGIVFAKRDWDMGPDLLLPEYAHSKAVAKALCVAALVEAHQRQFERAAQDLKAAQAFGQACGNDPTLIGMLVKIAIDAIVYRTTEFCLAEAATSTVGLKAIQTAVLDQGPAYDVRYAFRGEVYMAVATTRNLERFGGVKGLADSSGSSARVPADPRTLLRSGEPPNLAQKAFMARSLQFWAKVYRFIEAHPDDLLAIAGYTDKVAAEESDVSKGVSHMLNGVLAPVFSQAIKSTVKGEADYRCHRALAIVLQYRALHKRFPKTLSEAGINLTDPFDNNPLRYQPGGGTVRVYSIGPNMKDDQGMAMQELKGSEMQNSDTVAAYPPVRSRN